MQPCPIRCTKKITRKKGNTKFYVDSFNWRIDFVVSWCIYTQKKHIHTSSVLGKNRVYNIHVTRTTKVKSECFYIPCIYVIHNDRIIKWNEILISANTQPASLSSISLTMSRERAHSFSVSRSVHSIDLVWKVSRAHARDQFRDCMHLKADLKRIETDRSIADCDRCWYWLLSVILLSNKVETGYYLTN